MKNAAIGIVVATSVVLWSDIYAQKTADRNEFVEAYAALGEPQAQHRELVGLQGTYDVIGRFRFAPDGAWEVFLASVDIESLLEGRFIIERIHGEQTESWPKPYLGLRILAYDNYQDKYVYSSMNSFGTAMLWMTGTRIDESRIVLRGPFDNPLTKTTQTWKTEYELVSKDRIVLREYPRNLRNQEYLGIETVYTRRPDSAPLVGRWQGVYRDTQDMSFEFRDDGTVQWSIRSDQFSGTYELRYWADYSVSPHQLELFGFSDGPLAGKVMVRHLRTRRRRHTPGGFRTGSGRLGGR